MTTNHDNQRITIHNLTKYSLCEQKKTLFLYQLKIQKYFSGPEPVW